MIVHAWPYRRPQERVYAEAWRLGSDVMGDLLPHGLPHWDCNTDVTMSRLIQIDVNGVEEDCGLPADVLFRLSVRCWPSTSLIRRTLFSEQFRACGGKTAVELTVTATGEELGGRLFVETLLELGEQLPYTDPFVAWRPGSVLWSDQVGVHLEGAAGLLPVAPVSFREAGLPERSAWYVSMDGGDWQQAAMGSLLVLLNTDNAAVRKAMEAERTGSTASTPLWAFLEVDIVTDLVGRALDDDAFAESEIADGGVDGGEELTMAGLVRALIRTYLARPAESVDDSINRLRDERRRDPSRFRAYVHAGIGFLREVLT